MDARTLVERDAALQRLHESAGRIADGGGGVVLVHGEPGVGKSALVRAAFTDVAPDTRVLVGHCDALSTPRPFGPLRDLAADLGESVHRALVDEHPPHEVFAAVLDELRGTPHVMVFEDVHWADEGTLDLVRYLGRRIASTRSLLVLTYRDVEVDVDHALQPVLGDLVTAGGVDRIALEPLSIEGVADLLGDSPLDAADVHAKTGGNPFFVAEVVAQPDRPVPDNVRDAILGRTVGLDADVRRALELVSCVPSGLADDGLAAAGIDGTSIDALVRRGLLVRDTRRVRFRHELGRLTVVDALALHERTALHRRLVEALADTPDHALLVHLARVAGMPDVVVEHATRAAGEAARAGAHLEAAAFLEIGLEVAATERRAELLESLSYERYHVDQMEAAVTPMEEAFQLRRAAGEDTRAAADLRWLSRLEWFCGRRDVAERHGGDALALAREGGDEREIGYAEGQLATLAMTRGDPVPACERGLRALGVAERLDIPDLRATMLITIGTAELMMGRAAGAERIRESGELAGRLGMDEHASRAMNNLSFFLVEERRGHEAAGVLDEAMRFTADRDLDTWHLYSLGMRARLRLQRGHWTAAWDDATAVLRSKPAPLNSIWPLLVRGVLAVRRRRDPDAVASLEQAWRAAEGFGEAYRLVPIAAGLAEHEWLTGEDVGGVARLQAIADRIPESHGRWQAGEIATWLARLGRDVPAGLDATGTPYAAHLAGDAARAAAEWADRGMPYERVLALVDGDDPAMLGEALEVCYELDAAQTAGWIRRRLRVHGIASPPRGPRATTRANPAGLTARQVDVLRALAAGLTNAEIAEQLYISEKTAGHHVSAILTKLGVASRRDAARLAGDLGIAS